MHDELDLRVIERDHDADPQYRAALRQRVAAILDGSEAAPRDDDAPEPATIDLAEERLTGPERHRRRWLVSAAAAAAAAAAIVAVVAVTSDSDTLAPADEPVPTIPPTAARVRGHLGVDRYRRFVPDDGDRSLRWDEYEFVLRDDVATLLARAPRPR